MVIIAGHLLVEEAERDNYVAAHRDLVSRARTFDGCIALAITADTVDPRRINNLEIWRDAEALGVPAGERVGVTGAKEHAADAGDSFHELLRR